MQSGRPKQQQWDHAQVLDNNENYDSLFKLLHGAADASEYLPKENLSNCAGPKN